MKELNTRWKRFGEECGACFNAALDVLSGESGVIELECKPTLILADIHARHSFLLSALELDFCGRTVQDLLHTKEINLVCLGDGVHSEAQNSSRWGEIQRNYLDGKKDSKALRGELFDSLNTMKIVSVLKKNYPNNFHFLRGNHDDVMGVYGKFCRVVLESVLFREGLIHSLGHEPLEAFRDFENSLPLVVRGENFVASHTCSLNKISLADAERKGFKVYKELSWTDNRYFNDNEESVIEKFSNNFMELKGDDNGVWFIGHRPVNEGLFRSQFNGRLVQINNPNKFIAALIKPGEVFDPCSGVFEL